MKLAAKLITGFLFLAFSMQSVAAAQNVTFTEKAEVNKQVFAINQTEHFFNSYKEDPLKNHLAEQGLKVQRPSWRKLNQLEEDKDFYNKRTVYKYNQHHKLEGVIFELSKVRDSDVFSFEIIGPRGKEIHHNVREILYEDAKAGDYAIKVDSDVFEQVRLKIYEADIIYPKSGLLLLTEDDAKFNYRNKIKAFLSRGGTVINLGSKDIHNYLSSLLADFSEIELEGEETKITHSANSYFYIPKDLFLHEETALRVVKTLHKTLDLDAEQDTKFIYFGLILAFLLLAFGLFYKQRKEINKWVYKSLYSFLRNASAFGILLAILMVVIIPLFIYWYKNFSGLDLLPGITIDQLIEHYNLRLIGRLILTLIAFVVILFSVLIAFEPSRRERIHNKVKSFKFVAKDNVGALAITVIILGVFITTFATDINEIEEDSFPQANRIAYEGEFDEGEIKVKSSIPLLLISEDESQLIAETMPNKIEIKKSLNPNKETYTEAKHSQYFGQSFNTPINGSITLRNKNTEFGNKDLFIHLTRIDGEIIETVHIKGKEDLMGTKGQIYSKGFKFRTKPNGIYGLKIENADPLNKGDYEIVKIETNSKNLTSVNDIVKDAKWTTIQHKLKDDTEFRIEPYQLEKAQLKEFWVSNTNQS